MRQVLETVRDLDDYLYEKYAGDTSKYQDILDGMVHDDKAREASLINNQGSYAQLQYLLPEASEADLKDMQEAIVNAVEARQSGGN